VRVNAATGNKSLDSAFIKGIGGEKAADSLDLLVVIEKWALGGVDVVRTVRDILNAGECPAVVAVLGRDSPEARETAAKLIEMGVPEQGLMFSDQPVRLSEIVRLGREMHEKGLRVDPVVWDITAMPPETRLKSTEPSAEQLPAAPENTTKAQEKTGGTIGHMRFVGDVVWFTSPANGVGQTTLVVSTMAMIRDTLAESVAVLDLGRPPSAHLKAGDPDFEDDGTMLKGETKWGDIYVPKEWDGDPRSAEEMAASLSERYGCVLVDAPPAFEVQGRTVTVVSEERERIALLKKTGTGSILVLNRVRDQGAEFLQKLLENEIGKRADIVIAHDPEARRAAGMPEAFASDAISRAAGELAALLAGDVR